MSVSAMVRHRNFVTCCFFPAPSKKLSTSSNSVLGWLLWPAQQVQALMQLMGTVLHQLGGMKLHPNCIHLIKITISRLKIPEKLALLGVPNVSMTRHFYSSEVSWWLVDVHGNDGPILNFYHSWNSKCAFQAATVCLLQASPSLRHPPAGRQPSLWEARRRTPRSQPPNGAGRWRDPSHWSVHFPKLRWDTPEVFGCFLKLRHYQIINHLNGSVKVNPHPLLGYVLANNPNSENQIDLFSKQFTVGVLDAA